MSCSKQLTLVLGFAFTLSACSLLDKPSLETVVQGTITDKYTKKPLAGIPVVLEQPIGHIGGGTDYDSLTATLTDTNGHYSISRQSEKPYNYIIKPDYYFSGHRYFDLTKYPLFTHTEDDGIEFEAGNSVTADFQLVPFIPTKVNFTASKHGRWTLNAWIQVYINDGQGYSGMPKIVWDTIPAQQQVSVHSLVYLVPNRTYDVTIYRGDNHCKDAYNCQDTNVSYEHISRSVAYPDTAIITIP